LASKNVGENNSSIHQAPFITSVFAIKTQCAWSDKQTQRETETQIEKIAGFINEPREREREREREKVSERAKILDIPCSSVNLGMI